METFSQLEPLGQITASIVVDAEGSAIGPLGTSKGIGNETDLDLLKWLRSRSEVVLTSGLTARLEEYKLPSRAKLAILTRSEVPHLANYGNKVLYAPENSSYAGAISWLRSLGYSHIHSEFGPTGFRNLVSTNLAVGLISSRFEGGIDLAAESMELLQMDRFELPELFIASVAGRG